MISAENVDMEIDSNSPSKRQKIQESTFVIDEERIMAHASLKIVDSSMGKPGRRF